MSRTMLLFGANAINIGADLTAMGDPLELFSGLPEHSGIVAFATASCLLQFLYPAHATPRS